MKMLRLLLCAMALATSAAAQAVVTWSIDILPEGVTSPPGISFNGKRTVNASGVSIWDVPLGTLGLPQEVIRPHYINDSGQVVSTVCESGNEPCAILALTTNGVMQEVPDPNGRPYVYALSNAGQILFGFQCQAYISAGPLPEPPKAFSVAGLGSFHVCSFEDINDNGQIIAWASMDEGTGRGRTVVFSPVPEPHAALLFLAAGLVAVVRLRRQ